MMLQTHSAGEQMFVDCAGQDGSNSSAARKGEIRRAQALSL
jgi:hypothetical protein